MKTAEKKIWIFIALFVLMLLCAEHTFAMSVTFSEDFNDGMLDPNLILSETSGFNLTLSDGKALAEKDSGIGNGTVRIETGFEVIGDFTATVTVSRAAALTSEIGLASYHSGGFTDIFFHGDYRINSNIFVSPGFGYDIVNTSVSEAIFQIRRSGDTIFEEFNIGNGFQVLHSATHANLADPVTIGLFLVQSFNNTGSSSGTFDDLVITAEQFGNYTSATPEPGTFLLSGLGLLGIMVYNRRRLSGSSDIS